jgi:hypothetical protein
MSNPIKVEFTAHNKRGSGSYSENFSIETEDELKNIVKEFDKNCPFSKYEMETFAVHLNGKDLSKKERQWFVDQDEAENIGF